MKYLVGIFAGIALFFSVLFGKEKKKFEDEKKLAARSKEEEIARKLAAAQLLTSNSKADYEKALADLPPDYKRPGHGG